MTLGNQKLHTSHLEVSIHFILITVLLTFFYFNFISDLNCRVYQSFSTDEAVYSWQANQISQDFSSIISEKVNRFHPPLFSLILSVGHKLQPASFSVLAFRRVALVISILSLIAIYFLGLRVSGSFLGLFCFLGLFNYPAFEFYKFFIMPDILLMFFSILLLIFLRYLKSDSSWKIHIMVGMIVSFAILTKWSGLILVPFVLLFYIVHPCKRLFFSGLKKFFVFPAPIIALTLLFLFLRGVIFGNLSPVNTCAISGTMDAFFRYWSENKWPGYFIFSELTPLFIVGVILAFLQKDRFLIFLCIFIIIGILGDSFLVAHDYRYTLYILPAFFILTGISLDIFCKKIIKRPLLLISLRLVLLISFLVVSSSYGHVTQFLLRKILIRSDYAAAGPLIKKYTTENHVVISSHRRSVRFFTDFDFVEDGGILYSCPSSKKAFQDLVDNIDENIIVDFNIYADRQFSDLRIFSDYHATDLFLNKLGFKFKTGFYLSSVEGKIPGILVYERKARDF